MINNEAIVIYNKGTKALIDKKYEKAVTLLKKSIKIFETTDAWLNLGTAYKFLDRDILCVNAFKRATSKDMYCMETCESVEAMAYNNLGLMAYVRGDDTLAESYYHKAIEIWKNSISLEPSLRKHTPLAPTCVVGKMPFYDAKWNLATCVLRQMCSGSFDRWAEGWDLYENRFLKTSIVKVHSVFGFLANKIWCGQRDCRVVIAQEQGLGDNIMFARFIKQLETDYNIKCALQVHEGLGVLLRANGINCPVEIDVRNFDYMLPLGSICKWVSYVDRAPYISASSVMELGSNALNIGVVFSGSSAHTNDRHRSCPSGNFKFLEKYGKLWSLNPGAVLPNWISPLEIKNWNDTASAVSAMDFIVTVDTSLAHLAGAMGVPTFMLQPCKETDFRYGVACTENIWYDSLKVISNPNSWEKCMQNLKKELLK